MSTTRLTRREVTRALVVAAGAGLLPGCGDVTTGATPEEHPEFVPGQPLPWRNWGANQSCRPARSAPETEEAIAQLVSTHRDGVLRPVGSGHSFSALVPTDGTLLACDGLSGVISTDARAHSTQVWAGTRLHEVGRQLDAAGHTLANLPDIDDQTLGGAIATSTHGTGPSFGSLSSFVTGLSIATPGRGLVECDARRDSELFHAARCSLGSLGLVTRFQMNTQPSLRLSETSRFEVLEDVLAEVESRRDQNRNFEFHAFPHSSLALVVTTNEVGPEASSHQGVEDPDAIYLLRDVYRWVGRLPLLSDFIYDRALRVAGSDAETVRVGPAHKVLTHDRLARFREMEYTVPTEAGPACLREILRTIRDKRIPVVFPIEYRYVKADDVWLSMFSRRDGCSISVHQYADEDYRPYFAEIEPIFRRYDGRPHWGKLHTLTEKDFATLYPRWRDFKELRADLDPAGRLLNPHLREVFGA